MKHAAFLVFLLPGLAACGATAPTPPAVSVGASPSEVEAIPEPVPESSPSSPEPSAQTLRGERSGLFLTDGDGHRFSVETIRTISPPATR